MEEIAEAEKNLEKLQKFVFDIRRFFSQNPEVAEKFKKFLEEKEELIY